MDEPLSNLDAKLRGEMRTELKRLHSTMKITFVYVTHDQLEAMTLGTKVCLMKNGIVQQYDKPLNIYQYPNNLFVADFIGNPPMNFIKAKARQTSEMCLEVSFFGKTVFYNANASIKLSGNEVILGCRPEYIHLNRKGIFDAIIYSALPAGMETTVKLKIDDSFISAVVFGAVDYQVEESTSFDITGNTVIAFDSKTGSKIGIGKISI